MRLFLLLCVLTISPATPQSQTLPVVIDGELDEPLWLNLDPQHLAPAAPGVPRAMGGEIRYAVLGRYFYFAATLPEPDGRITARSVGRNPHWEEEDLLRIVIGVYPDWVLQVGPLGAYSIEKKDQAVPTDRFLAAARVGAKEWRVEAAIPLNELGARQLEEIRFSVERVRAMRPGSPELRWRWPEHGPAAKLPASVDRAAPAPLSRPESSGDNMPAIEAGRRQQLPPSDSAWDDPPWRDVPPWKLVRDEASTRPPRFPVEVKLMHDGRTLAVLARCDEPGKVRAEVKERDGPVNQEDSFQIYLATTGSAYAQFAVNPLGTLLDAAGMSGGPRISRPRTDWNSSARAAARLEPGGWTARLDIPLEETARVLGEPGIPSEWRILLLRFRPGRDGWPRETSVLPVIQSETPFCPARYLRLALVSLDPGKLPRLENEARAEAETRVFSAEQRKQLGLSGMLERHLRDRVRRNLEEEQRAWEAVQTRADWERFREPRIQALAASVGQVPPRAPLQTRATKEYAGDGYRRQDLVYQSRPGLWVTANLYLPAQSRSRMPGIVIVHSHHRPRTQAELQDMGILWARAGCAVLIPDQIGAGERLQNYPWNREAYHSRYVMGMQLYLAGESLIGWMVWDIRRGVDLLLEQPGIHPEQIILLGAVAGGGDPAAVAAALDPRIAAVAPFNFGESTPESPRFLPEKNRWPLELADPGWGSWESTRCLRRSIADGFLPWLICASVAPRRFVYAFEMGWNVEDLPAWKRYQKVFGFYDARDNLDEAHGFGPFPGPGECTNIGPAQRKSLYPELQRWFGIPIPAAEPDDRRPEVELASLTPATASGLSMRMVHELAYEIGRTRRETARAELRKLAPDARREWLRARWAAKLGDIEPNRDAQATLHWKKSEVEAIGLRVEPGILVPLLLMKPARPAASPPPVVIMLSQGGKERLLADRAKEIEALLAGGAAVCLPDVRGTGETSPDSRRGPMSTEMSLAATELMLGNSLLGARLKDLRTVLAYLARRGDLDPQRIALWGDSPVPVNPTRLVLDELQWWQVGPQIQQQAEPLGGLLAILGALFENSVRAVAVRRGLADYLSILGDRFAYMPLDAIVPGALEAGDLADVAAALAPRPLLLESIVDGRNRVISDADLRSRLAPAYESYRVAASALLVRSRPGAPDLPRWILNHL